MKKSLLFVKFEIMLPVLCFLLDPLTNKHCMIWSSTNLWIDSRRYLKQRFRLSARQRSSNYLEPSKENVLGEYDGVTLTMLYLKSYDMVSQNSFKHSHHALEISVLNIEEKFSHTLRTLIL